MRNMESNIRELTNSNSTVSFSFHHHDWLYIRLRGDLGYVASQCARILFWSTILSLCSIWTRCFLVTSMEMTISLPSQQQLFSGSLAAVKKTVFSINFFILNPLLKGHPLKWMCSAFSWNHTEWASVHKKPMVCFPDHENGKRVVLFF